MSALLRRFSVPLLVLGLSVGAGALPAQTWTPQPHFIVRLSESELLATGVHELSDQEKANLENLVAYEIASARAGGVTGFAGTFSSRRSAEELKATGMDRLSDEQRTRLDEHVAGYLADTPRVPYISRRDRSHSATTANGVELPPSDGPKLEVHGEVTVEVGASSQGSYYGGSMTTVISDPKGRFNAVISYGTLRGDIPYYDRYGRYDPYDPYYRPDRVLGPVLGPVVRP